MTLDAGTVVHVRSGGPLLTVLSVADETATCLFFSDELGEFKEVVLPLIVLDPHKEDDEAEDDDEDEDGEDETEEDAEEEEAEEEA